MIAEITKTSHSYNYSYVEGADEGSNDLRVAIGIITSALVEGITIFP